MPLLKRKPFTPENPPENLDPNEEVFVCVHTNEVFTDYESFFARTIQCNSLVWSCKYTGKSNLTYTEALKSERDVVRLGNSLCSPLQRATLYLVHHIQRGRLANLCDEVFSYLKDRYQEGEEVEVQQSGKRRKGKIQKVIEPEDFPNSTQSKKPGQSSGKEKKVEKSTSTPGKIRKSSEGSNKSRKSSESGLKSPTKSKSAPELLETPEKSRKDSSSSTSPKSTKKEHTPKTKKNSSSEPLRSPKSKTPSKELNGDDDVIIINEANNSSDSNLKSPKSPKKSSEFWPDAKSYKYAVQLYHEKESKKNEAKEVIIVDSEHISRKKGSFTRDKLKNYLKLSCERTNQNAEGFYYVLPEYRIKFDLGDPIFEIPVQLDSPPKARKRKSSQLDNSEDTSSAKKKKKKTDDKSNKDEQKGKKKKLNESQLKKLTPAEKLRLIEEEKEKRRKAIEEDKEKKKLQKEQERMDNLKKREEEKERRRIEKEQLKEQKRHEALLLKEWSKPREDLELDDLKDLPDPCPVEVKISNDLFGDAIMVVEFLYVFGSLFDMKDEFPSGLTFSMLEEALADTDPEGVYYDLLQFLLGAILRTHMEEEEDEGLESADSQKIDLDDEDYHSAKVSASATMAAVWPMLHQGKPLHELIMDPFTCTELLRLHLLSSGARVGCGDSEYRWQSRGGFTYADDAGVEFRHREPHIMKYLMTGSVYDLNAEEKLKIVTALCGQLMTYATLREHIEDGFDKLKKARREWLSDQWAEQRREKEEAAARYRKRLEERMKKKEEIEKRNKEKENENSQENSEVTSGKEGTKGTEETKQTKESKKTNNKKKDKKENEDKKDNTSKSDDKTDDNSKKQEEIPLTKEEEEQLALQKKLDRDRREQDYLEDTRKAVSMSSIQPLGRDRIYRRYWSFRSIKGLFVEEDDPDLPTFLETIFEEENYEDDGGKDSVVEGEMDVQTTDETSKDPEKEAKKLGESRLKKLKRNEIIDKYGQRDETTRWSFIAELQDFDSLINALNPRGHRERVLREALQSDYRYLTKTIEKCPFKEDNSAQKKPAKFKPRKQQTIDKSRYKTNEEFLEANLRDQILDLEDRLWQGGLGIIKTEDRVAWRVKVENGIYSHMNDSKEKVENGDVEMKDENDESLVNGAIESSMEVEESECKERSEEVSVKPEKEQSSEVSAESKPVTDISVEVKQEAQDCKPVTNGEPKELDTDPELVKVEEQKDAVFSSIPSHLKLDISENRLTGSPDQSRVGTPVISLAPTSMLVNSAVKELALALLKVEQGIESKYLSLPLGEDEETRKQKQKDAAALALAEFNEMMKSSEEGKDGKKKKTKKTDENSEKKDDNVQTKDGDEKKEDDGDDDNSSNSSTQELPAKQKTCLERWEESLMACSSLAQVFVHLNTLDGSITWSKSVLNARCRLCRRKGDGEKMLLCDACDRGHHMYCLKPPIKQIPEGNWFCPDCRPKEPRRSDRRRRAPTNDEDEEEEEEEEGDSEEEEDSDEESEEEEDSEENDSDADSEHLDVCALCEHGGELLCCDVCPLAYHMDCAYPPLRRIPRGSWACQVCTGADDERPKKCRVKKTTIKAALSSVKEKEKEKQKPAKKSKSSKTSKDTKKRSTSPVQRSRAQKEKPGSASRSSSSKRSRTRESSPSSSISSTPVVTTRRKRKLPALRINGSPSVDSSRSPSPVRKSATKRDPRLAGRMIKCGKLLDELMENEDADFFLEPINLSKYPNYNSNPLDLGTIKANIQENAYSAVDDFVSDVRKVFFDCAEHFRPRAKEARAGVRLSAFFETRLSEMALDVSQRAIRTSRRT